MIRNLILFLSFLLLPEISYSQLQRVDESNGSTREVYEIDKNSKLRQGKYVQYFEGKMVVYGEYKNGMKNGKWVYLPDKEFKMVGYFNDEGQKDSVWSCYMNGTVYSTNDYITGDRYGYYPDGNLRYKYVTAEGKRLEVKYSKKGAILEEVVSDSVFSEIKRYNKKEDLIEHVILKNNVPYEIYSSSETGQDKVFIGSISKGNGLVRVMLNDPFTESFFLVEEVNLVDSKPEGVYKSYTKEGNLLVEGQYENGFMVGEWIHYKFNSGEISKKEIYSLDDQMEKDEKNMMGLFAGKYYDKIDEMPVFKGGDPAETFRRYIAMNLRYPLESSENGIQGRVIVQFAINSEGKLVYPVVMRSVDKYLDEEALRVVNASPPWRPGIHEGQPVKVLFTFPINFILQ